MKWVLLSLAFFCSSSCAISQSKKDREAYAAVHGYVIDSLFKGEVVVMDSVVNDHYFFNAIDPKKLRAHGMLIRGDFVPWIDPQWANLLEKRMKKKKPWLREYSLLHLKGFDRPRVISQDSLTAIRDREQKAGMWSEDRYYTGIGWVRGRLAFSGVILLKHRRRAVVGLNRYSGSLNGEGRVLFLKKRKGKWKIVEDVSTWIS